MLYPPELRPHVENDACDGTVPPASSAFFSLVEQPPHSMVSSRSRASTFSCADTYTFFTMPVTGAYTVLCIFIASITSSRSPFCTRCPDLTCSIVIAPGIGAPTSPGFAGIGFRPGAGCGFQRLVADLHFARLPVQFEEHGADAVRMRHRRRSATNEQRLAGLQFDRDLFAFLHAVEELRSRQHFDDRPTLARAFANFRNTSGYIR